MSRVVTEGARVVFVGDNHKVIRGTVKKVYLDCSVVIVDTDDGETAKVHFSDLGFEEENDVQEEQTEKRPVEKSEITITPEEFAKIASRVIAGEVKKAGSGLLGMAFTIFITKLHKALFFEGDDD